MATEKDTGEDVEDHYGEIKSVSHVADIDGAPIYVTRTVHEADGDTIGRPGIRFHVVWDPVVTGKVGDDGIIYQTSMVSKGLEGEYYAKVDANKFAEGFVSGMEYDNEQ